MPQTFVADVVEHDAVRGGDVLLEGHGQLLLHDTHVDGQVSAVEGHEGGQGLLGIREQAPDLYHVVYSGETEVMFNTCREV